MRKTQLMNAPDREFREHVIDRLDAHDSRLDDHDNNFGFCDQRFKDTIAELKSISDSLTLDSEKRHNELLDKFSTIISITENSKKGVGILMWIGAAIKKISATIKEFIFVFVVMGVAWNIYTKNLTTEQLSQIASKFMGGK